MASLPHLLTQLLSMKLESDHLSQSCSARFIDSERKPVLSCTDLYCIAEIELRIFIMKHWISHLLNSCVGAH